MSTVSNLLIFIILVIFVPLIVAALVIISFTFVTSLLMIFMIVALGCGCIYFEGQKNRKVTDVVISAGDARIEREWNLSSCNQFQRIVRRGLEKVEIQLPCIV